MFEVFPLPDFQCEAASFLEKTCRLSAALGKHGYNPYFLRIQQEGPEMSERSSQVLLSV